MATLAKFLKDHSTKAKKDAPLITHTRIGDKENNIYGGSYIINPADEDEFYDLVYKEVIQGGKLEYLTEKQIKNGAIYIDLDFRYNHDVETRQHDHEWTEEFIGETLNIISELMHAEAGKPIEIYILQKDGVNRLADGSLTKDGIHIIIGLNMPNKLQLEMRKRLILRTTELLGRLPLINNAETVFDEGLPKGTTNCQMFGSRKPAHDAYKLVRIGQAELDPRDREWMTLFEAPPPMTKELFKELCIRNNTNRVSFELSAEGKRINDPVQAKKDARPKEQTLEQLTMEEIMEGELYKLIDCFNEDRIDNYQKWTRVGWAIKNCWGDDATARELFIAMNQKCDRRNNFTDMQDAGDFYDQASGDGSLTKASLHYWAREDDPEKYSVNFPKHDKVIRNKTADELFEALLSARTEVAFARYFDALYQGRFKCTNIKDKLFYEFNKQNLWVQNEGGTPIRNILSNELKTAFIKRIQEIAETIETMDEEADAEEIKKLTDDKDAVAYQMMRLEQTSHKNNVLREIQDLILDTEFSKTMNKEKYILPIKGGKILNMKTLEVEDRTILNKFNYECDVNYRELTEEEDEDIAKYFEDLFCGSKPTVQVVLNILKSTFTGETLRYLYFITGSGRNGKSTLFNVLKAIFNKAMDIVSKDLVLQKKSNTHLNTEVEKLDRCRLGYTTELKEEDKMNETMIKAITGGDAINIRTIQKTDDTLNPTANLYILTNKLPKFEVEQAICDRLIIIPFNNTFPVDKSFEERMLAKKEQVFCYIMKHGIIQDKFELTEEMKVAKENYIDDNEVDYLKDFIESTCDTHQDDEGTPFKHRTKYERDAFRADYTAWCNQRQYKKDSSTNTAFTRKMKMRGFDGQKSGAKTYYMGLKRKDHHNEDVEELDD